MTPGGANNPGANGRIIPNLKAKIRNKLFLLTKYHTLCLLFQPINIVQSNILFMSPPTIMSLTN